MTFPKKYYRDIYTSFGYPLAERSCTPEKSISAAEQRLGVRVPEALHSFYRVAGRERRFNHALNHVMPPQKWFIDKGRLVFMKENQHIGVWGVSIRNLRSSDPTVSQGFWQDDTLDWYAQQRKCSVFLAVMLHYQAVSGGFRYTTMATAPVDISARLKKGWSYYGIANKMKAYSRQNQAVCLSPFMGSTCLFAGAKTKRDFQAIADDLSIIV